MSLATPVSSGATVAFESIDGPPPEVFRKLVANLNDEAGSRQISVVSRAATPTYRVRGYVSALVERDKTTFAWVWDVYDTDKRRTVRITGEEPAAARKRRDAWAAADEPVLRRMAKSGMDRMAAFLGSPDAPPAAAPEPNLVTLVAGRDDSPESAGIVRVFGTQDQTVGQPSPEAAPEEPAPPPKGKKRPASARQATALVRTTDGRSSQ